MTIDPKFIERAREIIATQCDRQDMDLRARLYRSGSNDDQPELRALARYLQNATPRPLHELLAEDEVAARVAAKR